MYTLVERRKGAYARGYSPGLLGIAAPVALPLLREGDPVSPSKTSPVEGVVCVSELGTRADLATYKVQLQREATVWAQSFCVERGDLLRCTLLLEGAIAAVLHASELESAPVLWLCPRPGGIPCPWRGAAEQLRASSVGLASVPEPVLLEAETVARAAGLTEVEGRIARARERLSHAGSGYYNEAAGALDALADALDTAVEPTPRPKETP